MDIDPGPFLSVIGAIIMWIGLIVVISMIKGFIVQGVNIAISELLLKIADKDSQERICRWLGDPEQILDLLDEINKKQKAGAEKT